MKLLTLPSNKAFLFNSILDNNPPSLKLLPFPCEDYSICENYFACYYYKTLSIYKNSELLDFLSGKQDNHIAPLLKQDFVKKLEGIDLYKCNNGLIQCIVSDKFGDMYRVNIQDKIQEKDSHANYLNSNLGIPKYIRYQIFDNKEYWMLGDEEKKIKIYNSANPHEIVSVWHLLNMHSIDIEYFGNKILVLLKYFDQISLKEDIHVHWLKAEQLEQEEYPGLQIPLQTEFNKETFKFYAMNKVNDSKAVIVFLTQNQLIYEVLDVSEDGFKSIRNSTLNIQQGNWDYLSIMNIATEKQLQILVSYGRQVELTQAISAKQINLTSQFSQQSLNVDEKIARIKL